MFKYTVFALLILLVSCEQEPEKAVDFDDLAPTSGKDYDRKLPEDSLQLRNERPESSIFLPIVDTLMNDSRWVKWDTMLYADRFGAKRQEKWFAIGKNDSLVLLCYAFRDSSMTKNAFFNWIDCFGPKCVSYRVGDNLRIPRRNALFLVGAKQLIVIEGNRPVNEMHVRAALLGQVPGKKNDPKKENWLYVVTVPRSGKTVWKRIAQGEEQLITKTDENN
jgi:hypothetical protein